jgi:geranylgeranylglycerol-phosphate geranylgeranyltransferase
VKTLFDLIRLRNAVISFLGVYVGAEVFSLHAPVSAYNIVSAAVSAAFILGGGNILNDYFDFEIDKINQPKRPIPSGRISRSDAFMLSFAMFLLGLGVANSINAYCLGLAFANTVFLVLYARYGKSLLLTSNIVVSYLVASVFVYGAAAVYSPQAPINPDGVKLLTVLMLCSFLVNFSREVVKDIEDVDGDRRAYSVTIPIVYGTENAKRIALMSAVACVIVSLAPLAAPTPAFNEFAYGITIILTDMLILASFTTSPTLNQRILVFGMTFALIAFLLGALIPEYMHSLRAAFAT